LGYNGNKREGKGWPCVWAMLVEYGGDDRRRGARVFRGYDGVIVVVAPEVPQNAVRGREGRGTALAVGIRWVSVGFWFWLGLVPCSLLVASWGLAFWEGSGGGGVWLCRA
jgi:hypothetical protein